MSVEDRVIVEFVIKNGRPVGYPEDHGKFVFPDRNASHRVFLTSLEKDGDRGEFLVEITKEPENGKVRFCCIVGGEHAVTDERKRRKEEKEAEIEQLRREISYRKQAITEYLKREGMDAQEIGLEFDLVDYRLKASTRDYTKSRVMRGSLVCACRGKVEVTGPGLKMKSLGGKVVADTEEGSFWVENVPYRGELANGLSLKEERETPARRFRV